MHLENSDCYSLKIGLCFQKYLWHLSTLSQFMLFYLDCKMPVVIGTCWIIANPWSLELTLDMLNNCWFLIVGIILTKLSVSFYIWTLNFLIPDSCCSVSCHFFLWWHMSWIFMSCMSLMWMRLLMVLMSAISAKLCLIGKFLIHPADSQCFMMLTELLIAIWWLCERTEERCPFFYAASIGTTWEVYPRPFCLFSDHLGFYSPPSL